MSMTLNLVDQLLARGRNLHELGQERDALHIFSRLSGFRQLPAGVAEEVQSRLAETYLGRQEYKRARRHLTAALRCAPSNPEYHYLMATALAEDETCDPERAAGHYRRSLALDPRQPRCLCEYGLLLLDLGLAQEAIKCTRQAVALAPDDPHAVDCLVRVLMTTDQKDEAESALRTALFRNPASSRFRELWNDFHFHELRLAQTAAGEAAAGQADGEGPVLLPFIRLVKESKRARSGGKIIRCDVPSPTPPPKVLKPVGRTKHRHAQ